MVMSAPWIKINLSLIAGVIYHICLDLENCRNVNDEILLKELANVRDDLSILEKGIDGIQDFDLKRGFQTELMDLRMARMILSNMLFCGGAPQEEGLEYREDAVVPPDIMVLGGFKN